MGLKELLEKNKSSIVKKWIDVVVNTYAPDTSQFLKSQTDQFANPVGSYITDGLASLFDELISDPDAARMREHLDPMIRVRAIQDFTPSQATAFILSLKTIVQEKTEKHLEKANALKELRMFEKKVDLLLFLAFDLYVECREQIYRLKANEEKNKVFKAFKRAGLISEIADDGPDLNKSTD